MEISLRYQSMEDTAPVVIDNGSGFCKVGYGGDDNPKTIIPDVVAVKKNIAVKSPG